MGILRSCFQRSRAALGLVLLSGCVPDFDDDLSIVKPLGAVGQVLPIQANIRNRDSVERAIKGAGIVINLVGIGYERGKQRFRAVHAMGARNIAEAAKALKASQLVHISALGADPQSLSGYASSKALGEAEVQTAFPSAVPSFAR